MSSDSIIEASAVMKSYRPGDLAPPTLRETVSDVFRVLLGKGRGQPRADFIALRGIDLSVKKGERLAIFGRNGAGKSTLMKILCQVSEPTSGRLIVRGRLAGVLEAGTGFHPELTGMENVLINGAVLGMRKRDIIARLPEIIAFSGLDGFLSTPLKRYSSGMVVRLAVAVALHLDAEILLLDEVLAVADQEFRDRCMARLHSAEMAQRTVLYVSHDLDAAAAICSRGIILDHGSITYDGLIAETVAHYRTSS